MGGSYEVGRDPRRQSDHEKQLPDQELGSWGGVISGQVGPKVVSSAWTWWLRKLGGSLVKVGHEESSYLVYGWPVDGTIRRICGNNPYHGSYSMIKFYMTSSITITKYNACFMFLLGHIDKIIYYL